MWTVECLFTDSFHATPLPASNSYHPLPVGLHPSKPAIARFANDVNRQQKQKKAAKYDPKQQLRGNQFPEEINVKRNQCYSTPIHPLGNSTDLHCWITYPPIT
jgi:hypothetical protein